MIGVLDYGMGNLGSVRNMHHRLELAHEVVVDPFKISRFDRILLPGVGAFDRAVSRLTDLGFADELRSFADSGKPLMGICLGMQLLLDRSEEGVLSGLGFIPGASYRFDPGSGVRVPHMGWNTVRPNKDHQIFAGLDDEARFYFVHGYHVVPDNEDDVLAWSTHGIRFASMVQRENVIGAQFHPEKSHAFGMQLLEGFATL